METATTLAGMAWREKLARARVAKGWSQPDLARRLGVGQNTVSRWESGSRQPSLADVSRWAAEVEAPLSWIFNDAAADEMPPQSVRILEGLISRIGVETAIDRIISFERKVEVREPRPIDSGHGANKRSDLSDDPRKTRSG